MPETTPAESGHPPRRSDGATETRLIADHAPTTLQGLTGLSRPNAEWDALSRSGTIFVAGSFHSSTDETIELLITGRAGPDFTYDWLANVRPMIGHVWAPVRVSTPFPSLFDRVRKSTSLPMAGLAVLVGAPRRTVYHWRATGHAPEPAVGRLQRLFRWISEVEQRAPGISLRQEFDPARADTLGALLNEGCHDDALEQRLNLLLEPKQPKRARLVTGEQQSATEDLALSSEEWAAALRAYSEPSDNGVRQAAWRPAEVTDSEFDDPT